MIAGNDILNPYPGPRPFERGEQSLFFGREREVKELLSLIIAHKVVVLYARSGAGKTSVLNAGLIPLLMEEGFEVLPVARVRGFRPEDIDPSDIANIYAFNALVGWSEDRMQSGFTTYTSIASFLEEREHLVDDYGEPLPRLVVFDQFEELFTSYPGQWEERGDFFRQVAGALEADPLLRVLFVMREDYLAGLDSYDEIFTGRLRTRYRLERLRQDAANIAVEGPLRGTGRSFAEGVAPSLIQELLKIRVESVPGETVEVTGEYVEPVQLQVVCQNLWESLPPDVTVITAQHLQTFGDVEEALKGFYERALETAQRETGVEGMDLRDWFDKELITPAGTRGTVFRGEHRTGGIPNSAVDVLEDQHIIRAEIRAGARWYELTHDRLIEPIRKSNEIWFQLRRAEEQQREVEAERQRAEEQQRRAEEQARINSKLLRLIAALIIVSLVAVGAAGVAFHQRRVAEGQRQIALARQLAVQADLTGNLEPELRVLLALESLKRLRLSRLDSSEAVQILRDSLLGLSFQGVTFSHMNHDGYVYSVIFSPDGAYLATASGDGAHLWEVSSGQGKEMFSVERGKSVKAIAFSPDGEYLSTASGDGARLWEVPSGQEKEGSPIKHNEGVVSVAFSPDGKYLATASGDIARLWEVSGGQEKEGSPIRHSEGVVSVAFSPDSRYLATASGNSAWVWEVSNCREVSHKDLEAPVFSAAFSPDGEYLALASIDGTARILQVTGDREVALMNCEDEVYSVAFSPDGRYLATASGDTSRLWFLQPKDLIDKACIVLTRNLTVDEWHRYLGDEPYRKTCPDLP